MDPDAEAMMNTLQDIAPLPTAQTVAHEYRADRQADLENRQVELVEIDHVETFAVPGNGHPVTVRLYRHGPAEGARPTIMYMHGGGFVTCSIDTHDPYCRTLARDTGLTVVSVEYRLAPEHKHPAAFEDCRAVLKWAASDQALTKGIDASKLVVAGDSAGGALAAALCLWARDCGGPEILHQLLIYPVVDNDFSTASYRENATGRYLTKEAMKWFWQQYIGEAEAETDQFAAPGKARDLSGLPPATIITAGYDPLRDDGANYAQRLEDAGVPVAYRDYPGTFHGFAGLFMLESARASFAFIQHRMAEATK